MIVLVFAGWTDHQSQRLIAVPTYCSRLSRELPDILCSQKKNRKSIIIDFKSIFEIDFDYEVMKSILKSIIIDFCRVFY